jgi:hypothetical protein
MLPLCWLAAAVSPIQLSGERGHGCPFFSRPAQISASPRSPFVRPGREPTRDAAGFR